MATWVHIEPINPIDARRQRHSAFVRELMAAFPFPIRKIQVNNGTEFPLIFALTCQELGVRLP
jgi:hypothetical protein